MKILFLDHDGVICLSTEWGKRFKNPLFNDVEANKLDPCIRFDRFNKKAVKVLNEIIQATDAEIVVSSDWKYWANLEEMGIVYEKYGVIKKPIDFTPKGDFSPDNFEYSKDEDLEQGRSWEIREWLKNRPKVTHWVAVDDLDMTEHFDVTTGEFIYGLKNFVLTPKRMEGIKQLSIKDKIIKFLI